MAVPLALCTFCAVAAVASPSQRASVLRAPQTRSLSRRAHGRAPGVNWPQFRFDDNHTGFNPLEHTLDPTNVPQLQIAWAGQLGQLVDGSSPAVVDGVAYIGSVDGTLWAYPANGCGQSLCTTPLWQSVNLAQIVDSPAVANGTVYIGSQTSPSSNNGRLSAFSASGCGKAVCQPLWQGSAGKDAILESSPAIAGGTVFVGAFDGALYAFNANGCGKATCRPLWRGKTGGSIESTPTVFGNVVFIGSDDGGLYAFNASGCGQPTCRPLWKAPLGGAPFSSTPAVYRGHVYIASQHALSAFSAAGCGKSTCAPLWQAVENSQFFNGSPAVAHGRIYIPLEDGLAVYNAKGCGQSLCTPLWLDFGSGQQAAIVSSPTVANGVVYAGRNTGEVLAWNAGFCGKSPCTNIWSGRTNDPIVSSSPTVVNGTLYIGGADDSVPSNVQGRLYMFALP